MKKHTAITIFVSYAEADALLYQELEKHLSVLRKLGLITLRHRRQMLPVVSRRHQHLSDASLILLLISPDFLACQTCIADMLYALDHYRHGKVRVLPILIRPVDWQDAPFVDLQCLPHNRIPVTEWPSLDAAFRHITQELRRLLKELGAVARPPSDKEHLNRAYLLKQVRTCWIDGVLVNSLHHEVLIQLGLDEQPSAVANPWSLIVQETNLPEHPLAAGTPIDAVYDEPGAGKTTLLLELASELLTRADQDKEQGLPVVFHLSSWTASRPPLEKWLIDELHKKYSIPYEMAQAWMSREEVIPLLDGLDEVAAEHRIACVSAINAYHRTHHLTPLVVCCRNAEYHALPTRVELHKAVLIQPLTLKQMDAYCEQIGEPVASLRQMLEQEKDFQELATTPLMLSIMTLVYQGASLGNLSQATDDQPREQRIFAQYVERALTRRRSLPLYPKEQTLHCLSWLAQQLHRQHQTVFSLEHLQPAWLPTWQWRIAYRVTTALVFAVIVGLVTGVSAGLIVGLFAGPAKGLIIGLVVGLVEGLTKGLIVGRKGEIRPVEAVTWSWKKTRREFLAGLIQGLLAGLAFGLVAGILAGLVAGILTGLAFGILAGLVGGMIGGMFLVGPTNKMLDPREFFVPNYGLSLSRRNGLRVGLVFGLAGVLVSGVVAAIVSGIVSAMVVGVLAGPAFGLVGGLFFGLGAVLQQALLLMFFSHLRFIPKNYVQFLDYAAERVLLRKVGGSYIFVHRLLQEYFAGLGEKAGSQPKESAI